MDGRICSRPEAEVPVTSRANLNLTTSHSFKALAVQLTLFIAPLSSWTEGSILSPHTVGKTPSKGANISFLASSEALVQYLAALTQATSNQSELNTSFWSSISDNISLYVRSVTHGHTCRISIQCVYWLCRFLSASEGIHS